MHVYTVLQLPLIFVQWNTVLHQFQAMDINIQEDATHAWKMHNFCCIPQNIIYRASASKINLENCLQRILIMRKHSPGAKQRNRIIGSEFQRENQERNLKELKKQGHIYMRHAAGDTEPSQVRFSLLLFSLRFLSNQLTKKSRKIQSKSVSNQIKKNQPNNFVVRYSASAVTSPINLCLESRFTSTEKGKERAREGKS